MLIFNDLVIAGAIRPCVLLLECGEWLASVQTNKLAHSSLLLLLHRLAEQGVARQSSAHIYSRYSYVFLL